MWKSSKDQFSPIYYQAVVYNNLQDLPTLLKSHDILARCYGMLLAHDAYAKYEIDLIAGRIHTVYQHSQVPPSPKSAVRQQDILSEVQLELVSHMESKHHEEEILWSYVLAMLILKDCMTEVSKDEDPDDFFSPTQAVSYLKYAYNHRFPLAVYDYACLNIEGRKGVYTPNKNEAKKALQLCLELDNKHPLAHYQLGELLYQEDAVAEAIKHYHLASHSLCAAACYQLGMLAFHGATHIERKKKVGLEYLCRAAELGHKEALYEVGNYYYSTPVVLITTIPGMKPIKKLKDFGFKLIEMSAKLGYGQAQFALSEMHFDGKDGEPDFQKSMNAMTGNL